MQSYMLMMRCIFLLAMLLPSLLYAQAIDNSFAYKNINNNEYLRFNYENDFFSARDRFYTQGVLIEYANPALCKNPVNRLFPSLHNSEKKYSISVEQDAYTPTSIQSNVILYDDRPYAASLLLKSIATSTDKEIKQALSGTFSIGVVGAAAGGEQMQTTIHEHTGNIIPQGWQYQVHTDIALNYQLNYEKNIISVKNNLLLNADGMIRAGTLSDKLSAGTTLMLGYFNSPFNGTNENKWQVYVYSRPAVNLIGYDATLQGGLFNRNSPYVIAAKDISRLCFENRFGLVLSYKRIYLEYFQSYLTKEFSTQADNHRWGGIELAVSF